MITYDEAIEKGMVYLDKNFIYDSPLKKNIKYYIKYILSIVLGLLYRFLLIFKPNNVRDYKYDISICTIFKNEAPFLKEWIEYHLLVGVDHFYLYNNNSNDNYLDVLQPYINNGTVSLIEWPENPGQISSYKNWYETYRHETQWVSFLDLDEFITPLYNNSLKTWIKKFDKFPIVMVYWKMFGTSGRMDHDDRLLVTEQYTTSWPQLTNIGKLFYQTSFDIYDFKLDMMHTFCVKYCRLAIPPINAFGYFVQFGIHKTGGKRSEIQINHYWSKAYNSYQKKHERGDAAFGVSPRDYDYFLWHEQRNISTDKSSFRFMIQMKRAITESRWGG